jgi:CMP-N-acetylneuraminic acid synthetase
VSTDNEMIAMEAVNSGAKVHWRSEISATDTASSLLAMQDFIHGHKG